ncbi:metal-binding protein [Streptomyces solincola]|uniref:Metal-binding protein n=1 Tax=Streptomyces solincola TaxID=2100817 RepID=A0A2S9PSQ4_9ACTN|nr:CHAD domain-containing protein [Streptomyces solincola]PRH77449.1 metal-binding protein [Streptomyces solincola]
MPTSTGTPTPAGTPTSTGTVPAATAAPQNGPDPARAPDVPAAPSPGPAPDVPAAPSPGPALNVPAAPSPGPAADVLARYLHARAGDFLRALRRHRERGADTAGAEEAARALRSAAARIGGTLHTFRPLLDPAWADQLRTELAWFSGILGQEHACTAQLVRLVDALTRLTGGAGGTALPGPRQSAGSGGGREAMAVGAARAGALLERQLTLARTRAHSAALQAFGSSRFHAVADAVALLVSEAPTLPAAGPLDGPARRAERKLLDAVALLPTGPGVGGEPQDLPWHQVRRLLELHRYAREVRGEEPVLYEAGRALDRHRDAAEAAQAAATAARTPRIAPATAYALGVLHADQRHEVEAARLAFRRAWRRTAVAM